MEITTSIRLFGENWMKSLDYLVNDSKIFDSYYSVYILAASIGIFYDEQMEFDSNEPPKEIPRIVLVNHVHQLDNFYQISILSSKKIELTDNERSNLAFDSKKSKEFGELKFLTKFANFGISKLITCIDFHNTIKTLDNINTYCNSLADKTSTDYILSKLSE